MNKKRRDILRGSLYYIDHVRNFLRNDPSPDSQDLTMREAITRAANFIEDIMYEEQDSLSNMPENLYQSYKYEKMETAVDALEDAVSEIEDAQNSFCAQEYKDSLSSLDIVADKIYVAME